MMLIQAQAGCWDTPLEIVRNTINVEQRVFVSKSKLKIVLSVYRQ